MKFAKNICSVGLFILFLITSCQPKGTEVKKVGIVTLLPAMEDIVTGFKEGMQEYGYQEGNNIIYFYDGPVNDPSNFDSAIKKIMVNEVDILFAVTTPGAQAALKAIEGTTVPVVFAAVTDPIGAGLMADLNKPGGNITGVMAGSINSESEGRRLELFMQLVPEMNRVYLPYNPDDPAAMKNVNVIKNTAGYLQINLVELPITGAGDAKSAAQNFPDNIDGVFFPSDRLIGSVLNDFISEANQLKLPTSIMNPSGLEQGALMAFGPEFKPMGKQAAQLSWQVLNGTPAGNLPVEIPDFFMGINLKTANMIGLDISPDVLQLASIILR